MWSVADARNNLAEIVNRVAFSNEEITIEKHGKPIVKIVPIVRKRVSDEMLREFSGIWKGKSWANKIGRKARSFRGRNTDL